jgi:NAD(P)-dependent dehydrogenase (short-subunit alcohol dehydrogenase family)
VSERRPDLTGQVAVITGANRGIGHTVATRLARAGARLAICGRDLQALAAADNVLSSVTECLARTCDVSDPESVDEFSRDVLDHFGRVDVVVANAGSTGPVAHLHETQWADWRECLGSNLDGPFLTFRAFIPSMLRQKHGSLIAFSSVSGKRPIEGRASYGAAKMGVIGLVRALALELGPHGIRANSVCPGGVEGDRFAANVRKLAAVSGRTQRDVRRDFADATPLRRLVSAEDVANVCAFLASDDAAAITGEDVNVSNGLVMY